MDHYSLTLHPTAPYDLELTTENQPYFRKGDGPSTDSYQRLLDLGEKLTVATVSTTSNTGNAAKPELLAELAGDNLNDAELGLAQDQLEKLLGLHQDVRPFYAAAAPDPVMAPPDGDVSRHAPVRRPLRVRDHRPGDSGTATVGQRGPGNSGPDD